MRALDQEQANPHLRNKGVASQGPQKDVVRAKTCWTSAFGKRRSELGKPAPWCLPFFSCGREGN